ncbi:MAG: GntR family transcriptional regulator [Actinomycetia bacterium]|nr:GntR family transcriptional regulator [Actinomycetes bacterium]
MRALTVGDDAFASKPDLRTSGNGPSHARIEQWLSTMIASGSLTVGDRLPPEGELAAAVGVSRMTLRQALSALEQRELVERRRGRGGGTFISRPRIDCDLTGLPGFTEQMRRADVRAGAHMVSARSISAPEAVATALDVPPGAEVYEVIRVRLADGEPLALEETYLPAAAFPGLLERELTGSLYSLMQRSYEHAPHTAREWLEPVVADQELAELLDTPLGSPLMLVTRTAYTSTGLAVEHAYDRYRADRTRIALRTNIDDPVRVEIKSR